ncbi:MAG: mechanosensitive ion channel protein [Dehalococcoidales bacterium]|jgi:small conductance mechanosensitive channel|nr:mechanosensitive ion channel protein [Dehalococcoidales bacterium]
MREWFITYGVWILIAVVVGFILFYLLRRWAPHIVEKVVPKQWQEQLKGSQRVVTWVIIGIGGVILALAVTAVIVSRYGVDVTPALKTVGGWLLEHGVPILIIILLSFLTHRVVKVAMPRLIERAITIRGRGRRAKGELAKRAHTLSGFLTTAIGAVIIIVAIFMLLSEVGIDITPLLAGAGVAGIALGFGAQSLIRDFLSGLFIILEDQYSKGDVVRIAGIAGLVEDVSLRRTVLRDLDGIVHSIPNGEVKTASNYTKEWSRVNLNIPVAYGEDLDRVIEVLNQIGKELAADETFGPMIIKAPQVLRVDKFGDSAIEIKVLGDTKPLKQWDVTGELRKRAKKAFDEEGIEIPWPHVKLYFGQSQPNKDLTCPACSHVNLHGSKFCANCGASLSSQAYSPSAPEL